MQRPAWPAKPSAGHPRIFRLAQPCGSMESETAVCAGGSHEPSRLDVVVIDDSPVHAELTLDSIRRIAPELAVAHFVEGREALHYVFNTLGFHAADQLPRLILLELGHPADKGLRVLERLASSARTRSIPVIVLSSVHEAAAIDSSYEQGAQGFIVKPDKRERYRAEIAGILDRWLTRTS